MQHMGVVKDFQITITNGGSVAIAPVITNQPQSLTVTQNNNATFAVIAGGTAPLSYQWRFALTNIGGATTSSYTRNGVQTNDAGNYTVVITNSAGAVTSFVATLTVLAPPSIVTPPQNQVVDQGTNATFVVSAVGSLPLGFQWRFFGGDISAATGGAYTRSNVQPAHVGSYAVVITNAAGGVTSAPALLNLNIPSPVLTAAGPGVIQWQGLSNLFYTVESKTNIADTNWTFVLHVSSPSNTLSFTNNSTTEPVRFYRVVYP
jgi:hypothetical protein